MTAQNFRISHSTQHPNFQIQPLVNHYSPQNYFHSSTQSPSTSNQQRFPSQNIPVQLREVKQHCSTHSQVFSKPKDEFKPTGKILI